MRILPLAIFLAGCAGAPTETEDTNSDSEVVDTDVVDTDVVDTDVVDTDDTDPVVEDCTDYIDNDGDRYIDCADDDCAAGCTGVLTPVVLQELVMFGFDGDEQALVPWSYSSGLAPSPAAWIHFGLFDSDYNQCSVDIYGDETTPILVLEDVVSPMDAPLEEIYLGFELTGGAATVYCSEGFHPDPDWATATELLEAAANQTFTAGVGPRSFAIENWAGPPDLEDVFGGVFGIGASKVQGATAKAEAYDEDVVLISGEYLNGADVLATPGSLPSGVYSMLSWYYPHTAEDLAPR